MISVSRLICKLTDAEASGYGFELAIGFLNLAEATSTNFNRSTGANSPDLVEFTYFPDAGYGATVWPIFADTNSDFNWNGASDYAIYAPNPGDWYHIVMTYTASNQTMVTTMTNFEQTSGVTIIDPLGLTFSEYSFHRLPGGHGFHQQLSGRRLSVIPSTRKVSWIISSSPCRRRPFRIWPARSATGSGRRNFAARATGSTLWSARPISNRGQTFARQLPATQPTCFCRTQTRRRTRRFTA